MTKENGFIPSDPDPPCPASAAAAETHLGMPLPVMIAQINSGCDYQVVLSFRSQGEANAWLRWFHRVSTATGPWTRFLKRRLSRGKPKPEVGNGEEIRGR
jgi:hypothetical protein